MSKFVTYGVTEMLDNDQKFIIDSDRTGPGSITAKDAASSLLSKWAGFDTFEEAVQNTIANNQDFIDRDTAIRSETAELKKKIVTTFPAKDAFGAVATFESEFEDAPLKSCIVHVEPVQDLHGYDSPWPAGGGKNKFNEEYPSIVSQLRYMPIFVGTGTYTLSTSTPLNTANATNLFLLAGNVSSGASTADNGVYVRHPKTVESIDGYVTIAYRNANGVNPANYQTQLELGSTATDYAPYSNICPITGWTGCEVQRTGVNVWDEEWEIGGISSVDGSKYRDVNRIRSKNFIPVKPSTPYYFKMPSTFSAFKVAFYGVNKAFLSFRVFKNDIITTPPNCYWLMLSENTTDYGTTYNNDISINYPSTDHDYHPYTGHTYPITFPTEVGAVYGAYVDVTGGELVVDRAIVDLGTLEWSYESRYDVFTVRYRGAKTRGDCVCSQYAYSFGLPVLDMSCCIGGVGWFNGFIVVKDSRYTDAATFKAAMSGVQLVYELAEPIHYPLTPTEIKTLLGQNNIWANTGDTYVEYIMSDVSWYVEKKLKAFQSVLAGVEDSAVASKNYSANTYLIFNDDIYRVTKAITAGETIEEGVNVTKTTVAEQLMALAQA